jgi:hypothetical protein
MILLVARQQSARQSASEVTGFLCVRAVTTAMQRLSKRTLQQLSDRFPWGSCRGVIWKANGATEQFSVGDSHGKFACEEDLKTV